MYFSGCTLVSLSFIIMHTQPVGGGTALVIIVWVPPICRRVGLLSGPGGCPTDLLHYFTFFGFFFFLTQLEVWGWVVVFRGVIRRGLCSPDLKLWGGGLGPLYVYVYCSGSSFCWGAALFRGV